MWNHITCSKLKNSKTHKYSNHWHFEERIKLLSYNIWTEKGILRQSHLFWTVQISREMKEQKLVKNGQNNNKDWDIMIIVFNYLLNQYFEKIISAWWEIQLIVRLGKSFLAMIEKEKKKKNCIYGLRKYFYSFSTPGSNIIRGCIWDIRDVVNMR